MNMFDEARSVKGMIEMCALTQGELAKKLGVSQSYVANKLRLLGFSDEMQRRICESGITERHARALLRLTDEEKRKEALTKIITDRLTVKDSEALVDFLHDGEAPKLIDRARDCFRVDKFKSTLKSSLTTLRSLGISATLSESFYGRKTYITICIEEP